MWQREERYGEQNGSVLRVGVDAIAWLMAINSGRTEAFPTEAWRGPGDAGTLVLYKCGRDNS